MEVGELITQYRRQAGMTIDELAARAQVPKGTLTKIIGGVTKAPTLCNIQAIARALGKTLADFDQASPPRPALSPAETAHLTKYRALDAHGKQAVDGLLALEYQRMEQLFPAPEEDNVVLFPTDFFLQSASAGLGDFNDDQAYETLDLIKRPPKGVSFLIRVSGDSMEPTFSDGDRLFIRRQDQIGTGEIGLFCRGGDLFVKEQGAHCLLSHNEAYAPVYPLPDTPIFTIGRVLGVCTPDYLPGGGPGRR